MNIDHQNCILLGKGGATQSDEFLEKFQRGWGGIFNPKIYIAYFGPLNRAIQTKKVDMQHYENIISCRFPTDF